MGKLFSFYTLIFSYKPTRDHHTVVISTKRLFRIISNYYTLQNLRKNISKIQVFRHVCLWISREKKKELKCGVSNVPTNYLS